MGAVVALQARSNTALAEARERIAVAAAETGGFRRLSGLLTERLARDVYPDLILAWASTSMPPADALVAVEDLVGCAPRAGLIAAQVRRAGLYAVASASGAAAADHVLEYIVRTPVLDIPNLRDHPLAGCVLRRDVIDLLEWPFTGRAPAALGHVEPPRLSGLEREAFFGHCRDIVERAARELRDPSDRQPHRQAIYLLQWDHRPETAAWLRDMDRVERRRWRPSRGWTPRWVTARSAAITTARQGDPGPLRDFIARGLADQGCQDADLAYWSYWVGEAPETWRTDEEMTTGLRDRAGQRVLDRLTKGITAADPLLDLHVHSAASLLRRRPGLLTDAAAAHQLRAMAGQVLDVATTDSATRSTLENIATFTL